MRYIELHRATSGILGSRSKRNTEGIFQRREIAKTLPWSCVQPLFEHSHFCLADQ